MDLIFKKSPEVLTVTTGSQVHRLQKCYIKGYSVNSVLVEKDIYKYYFSIMVDGCRDVSTGPMCKKDATTFQKELESIIENIDNF